MFGMVSALIAGSLAVAAFWPRQLPVLEPRALREYLAADERFTLHTVVDTYIEHFTESRDLLRRKGRTLKLSMSALGISILGLALDRIWQ